MHIPLAAMPITGAILPLQATFRRGAASRHLPAAASMARSLLGEEDSPVDMQAVVSQVGMQAAVSPVGMAAVVSPADTAVEGDK